MLHKYFPYEYLDSPFSIDYQKLYDKGFRGIIFDIDNTLVPHDAPCTDESDALLRKLLEKGFKLFIISNNEKERCEIFIPNVKIDYISKGGKPKKDSYLKAFDIMGLDKTQVAAVGDQLFTDCLGAKNAGIKFIKVGIISKKEPPHIKLKRILEKPIELLTR